MFQHLRRRATPVAFVALATAIACSSATDTTTTVDQAEVIQLVAQLSGTTSQPVNLTGTWILDTTRSDAPTPGGSRHDGPPQGGPPMDGPRSGFGRGDANPQGGHAGNAPDTKPRKLPTLGIAQNGLTLIFVRGRHTDTLTADGTTRTITKQFGSVSESATWSGSTLTVTRSNPLGSVTEAYSLIDANTLQVINTLTPSGTLPPGAPAPKSIKLVFTKAS